MKIQFKYSNQYNNALAGESADLSWKEIQSCIDKIEIYWGTNEKEIIESLQKISGLKFNSELIVCYLNTKATLSEPLSLKIEKTQDMKDNLIHELIHILFTQNYSKNKKFKEKWDLYYKKEFQNETNLTRTHLIVHSLHYLITKNLFPSRIKNIKTYTNHPEYVRSWQLVDEIGSTNLLNLIIA